jgi:copper(I)-binding protein
MKRTIFAALAATTLAATAAFAGDVQVNDPYVRVSTAMSVSGAAFMVIDNRGATDDRLVDVRSDAAERVELHTHEQDANGVMRMIHVEEGFDVPANGEARLERGGKHVMFLGLTRPLSQGDVVTVTLVFESAGEIVVEVPVDNDRPMNHGG